MILNYPRRPLILRYDTGKIFILVVYVEDIRFYVNESHKIRIVIEDSSGRYTVRVSMKVMAGLTCTTDHLSYKGFDSLEWKIVGHPRQDFKLERILIRNMKAGTGYRMIKMKRGHISNLSGVNYILVSLLDQKFSMQMDIGIYL